MEIVGVAVLFHEESSTFSLEQPATLQGGVEGGRERPPTLAALGSRRGPRAGLADVAPPSCARRCHQGTARGSCGHSQSPQAAERGRDTVSSHADPEMWCDCPAVIGHGPLGNAPGMAPSVLGAALPCHLKVLTSPGTLTPLSWLGESSSQRRSWPTTGRGQTWADLGSRA